MSKRSKKFDPRPRDLYETFDHRAVDALMPHLPATYTYYAEPCAGNGALIENMSRYARVGGGPVCRYTGDIASGRNAFDLNYNDLIGHGCAFIITNPPWTREILHEMIVHFAMLKPTWLLFDSDWAFTQHASRIGVYPRKIVSVGRIKFIRGSQNSGFDNCAWYFFDGAHKGPAELFLTGSTT